MRKWKKRIQRKKRARQALLAIVLAAALGCAAPVKAATVVIAGETVNDSELGTASGPATYTVGAGLTKTTWANADQTNSSALRYKAVVIENGGVWRPMDLSFTTGDLTIGAGAVLDMTYKYENYPYDGTSTDGIEFVRNFNNNNNTATKTVFYDGAILRGTIWSNSRKTTFTFKNPQFGTGESSATVKVQWRFDKSFFSGTNSGVAAGSWEAAKAINLNGTVGSVITLRNLDAGVEQNLSFVAEVDNSYVDDALHKYLFVPTLTTNYVSGATKYYDLSWTATRTDFLSQGVFSAANAQLSLRNLWRIEDGLFWKRGEELRAADRLGQDDEGADGAWAQIWRGKYDFDGVVASGFGQSYDGIQLGYDKQREGKLFGGKLHSGLFLSLLNSDADFHQHTVLSDNGVDKAYYTHANGDLDSKGIGLYTTWAGDKGHYLDFTVRGSRLSNKYQYYDADDNLYDNDYSTWTYGAGFRYGYQQELHKGWYWEPQAGLSYGTMKDYSYTAGNNLRYNQEQMDMLIGRFGVTAGRNFTHGDKRGTVYAKAAVNHDFKDGGSGSADALVWDASLNGFSGGWKVGATLPMNTLAGKDTWYEFALGANLMIGKDKNAFVELTKTTGGKVNTDWQVNAGLSWRFNGPVAGKGELSQPPATGNSLNEGETLPTGQSSGASSLAAQSSQAERSAKTGPMALNQEDLSSRAATNGTAAAGDGTEQRAAQAVAVAQSGQLAAQLPDQVPADSRTMQTKPASGDGQPVAVPTSAGVRTVAAATETAVADSGETATFTLEPLVVEAKRPDWEKKLSPGTVSVIHVPEYKGEMKNLPDLLQTVPGVYVQRLQGTGHYSVARVRGSTGGQVNIYVDGVLVNSNADAAVDLSTIPVENVERIEVYRGYVPARFAGAPIGGAINIVTKKPQDTKGSITTGLRSFDGYTGNLEVTAPVGGGSMLFALNRDQAAGDFHYDHVYQTSQNVPAITESKWRKNNDYHNTDALLKWQDDNWFAKLTYQNNSTAFPQSAYGQYADDIDLSGKRQEIEKTELSLGRRQTAGNLEWGWRLDGSYQYKQATDMDVKSLVSGNVKFTADNEFRNRRLGGAVDGSWKMGKAHLVEFLLDTSRETMKVDTNNYNKWPNWDSSVGSNQAKALYSKFFKNDYQSDNYYFQVQDTMTLNKSGNLFFTPVLRAQKLAMDVDLGDPDLDRWNYSYGLGLKKVQNDHWTFRSTYGTYHKYPNWYELFGDGVNVKSRWEMYSTTKVSDYLTNSFVEHGTSWDVSANWQGQAAGADADVTLTYFNRRSKNLLSYTLDPYGFGYYTNLAAGNIQGLELESKLLWKRWDLLLAATWNDSMVTKGGKDGLVIPSETAAGNPFPWIPEWEGNIRLGYRFPGDKLSVFGEYHYLGETGVYFGSKTALYEPLGLINIGLKYDINKELKLTTGINDLFDKGPDQLWYRSGYGTLDASGSVAYPQQGRTYYMTMQYFF
ncbi:TonB-dependent receptor domain-containing protein [Propionispora vibrioides]|uniref:Outer membrane autotransporter barrel domain-containing protein n=1 Tax=Propionispora vibrioides TaxID=112903 RepID=A0A1H8X546_9FIRM|nr:TonB-dependent receptor [Propionispora vibrioides]SEP35075.1 outer membrane autotransporter barrel domain-containing protein [Propionispora vibrioides]